MSWDAALYLEKGHLFLGKGFGARTSQGGEVVFNTGMCGYQEIYTDPSYSKQIVVMTYPHIGNTGVNKEDVESRSLFLGGVVCREYCDHPSNWRSTQDLSSYLAEHSIPGLNEVDTRLLTQIVRNEGAQRGIIFPTESKDKDACLNQGKALIEQVSSMEGLELVSKVSCKEPYLFEAQTESKFGTIVVYDYGVKLNILRHLKKRGFKVQVVPHDFPASEILKFNPACLFLSNGPGDPATVKNSVEEIERLIGKLPIFAICMGHQLLARALGNTTFKLKFGHHGINHPVKDLTNGKIYITSQNHGFAVNKDGFSANSGISISHISLNDETVEGFSSEKLKIQSVQFHPESAPGPHDGNYLFDRFVKGYVK